MRGDFHRHLVGGAADTARLDLNRRGDVAQRLLKDLNRVFLAAGLDEGQRIVQDALGHALLAAMHDAVDEHGHFDVAVANVRGDFSLGGAIPSGHALLP